MQNTPDTDPPHTLRPTLRLGPPLRARLTAAGRAGYPSEACGLLVGRRSPAGTEVLRVTAGRNLDADRTRDRYTLDPLHLLEVETEARSAGLDVVGVWHSHPDGAPVPSESDRRGAWDGWSYVIVSVTGGTRAELRSWRLAQGRFVEERVLALEQALQPRAESGLESRP